jgi:hypothetical protein
MKLIASTFFLLLLAAHGTAARDELLGQPLSLFRDGEQILWGYSIFVVLLLVGMFYTAALARSDRVAEAAVAGLAVLFLAVVTATPSLDGFHVLCSLVLLLLLFWYYALLLYRAESLWLCVHLAVPLILVSATGFHSYGLWQKSLICYFILLAVIHHHRLVRPRTEPQRSLTGRRMRNIDLPSKRRKVYLLEPGREWARQRIKRGEA